jgi:biotin carboxylase
MVVAGSMWQIPLVLKLRQLGLAVLVVNLYEDSPAFRYADYLEVVDILDLERCLKIATSYDVDAVCSDQSDIAVPTVAYISEKLGLQSIGADLAKKCTNKYMMREHCSSIGIKSPAYQYCSDFSQLQNFYDEVCDDIVVKPLDSNSSRGVFVVREKETLRNIYERVISISRADKALLAEEYIEGTEFTVDGIVIKDRHYSLATSRKKHYTYNSTIAYELFFTFDSAEYDYNELKGVNDRILSSLRLPDGTLSHAEYKYHQGVFKLIEFAARGGGNLLSSRIVPYVSGFDNYHYYLNSLLGEEVRFSKPSPEKHQNNCAVIRFFDITKEGQVCKIHGESILKSSCEVTDYKFNFSVGDYVTYADNDAARIGFYIAVSDDEKKLRSLMDCIENQVSIEVE